MKVFVVMSNCDADTWVTGVFKRLDKAEEAARKAQPLDKNKTKHTEHWVDVWEAQ